MPFEESAEDEIRRFEEQFRNQPESLVFARLADAYRKSGDLERSLEVLDEGIGRHPDYLSAHIVRARTFRELGRSDEARSAFERVIELDAQNLVAIRGLAEIARESGDVVSELAWLERLEQADPQSPDSGLRLAELRELRPPVDETAESPDAGELPELPAGEEWWSDGPLASGTVEVPFESDREADEAAGPAEPARAGSEDSRPDESGPGLSELVSELWSGPSIEPVRGRVADSFAEELNSAILDDEPPASSSAEAGLPSVDAWWFEPPPEPGAGERGEGEAAEDGDQDADLLTRTMAELYARQGLVDEAEAIYRELLIDRPDDESLRAGLEAVLGMRAARGLRPSVGVGKEVSPADEADAESTATAQPEVEIGQDLPSAVPSDFEGGPAPGDPGPSETPDDGGETAAAQLVRVLREGETLAPRLPESHGEKSVLEAWLERLRG